MRYAVTHETRYSYSDSVPLCHNVLHLEPRETGRQKVISHSVAISPNPVARSQRLDFFGNPITWFSIQEPHEVLSILAKTEIDVAHFEAPAGLWLPAWDKAADALRGAGSSDLLDARQYTLDSTFVSLGPEMADYARPSFPPGRQLLESVTELTRRIFTDFKFDSGVTTIGTPVQEILAHRHGVCQDFAHLQIACLRSLGLAARYVSGYLVTHPPPDGERLIGADASHAWVSVFFPDYGWIDFDPTNGVIPSAEHITIAWARDYDDVSPVRGVVVGGRRHNLSVAVDVEPIPATP
ncbi:MAG TPA: transglutaminase family protein [Tepidisphaeraceae bacterium]|nr:transglutaminase family protein [Tepidisphaeraceae bacterium]